MKKLVLYKFIALIAIGLSATSCGNDYLDTAPTDQVDAGAAFLTTANAYAALNGIHRAMFVRYNSQGEYGQGAMMINMDMMGEDLVMTSAGNGWYNNTYKWLDHRNENSALCLFAYQFYYRLIGNANLIIANIGNAEGPQEDRDAIKGQALCYRAWAHFMLVQLYGKRYDAGAKPNNQLGVPLMLTPTTDGQARATVEEVYTQVNQDLDDAIALLTTSRRAKSHFNKEVAQGIKARVALTQQNWTVAAQMAVEARKNYSLMSNAEYLSGFDDVSNAEWIWGTDHIDDQTTFFASFHAYISCNFNSTNIRTNPKAINSTLYEMMSATDVRRGCWLPTPVAGSAIVPPGGVLKPYMTQKFLSASSSNSVGDVPHMRAGEMYLIEAEAKARMGDDPGAQSALTALMSNRDPGYVPSGNVGQALIDEILINRRIELWGEGFRFTDLKRLNLPLNRNGANHISSLTLTYDVPAGDVSWEFLIPRRELDSNKLAVQNPL
ncbi:MAG: RagB/SusD family nutrient uptake outer membrane protein [Lewinellaceae bacterium]|nr:RagB/SusD family nutrient uptake outer membrane protein [Lewinella sp.]MCB9277946.1 RagB/SusD family nutrient uptake outer membrane protein [Lewinellaceae bacterium]